MDCSPASGEIDPCGLTTEGKLDVTDMRKGFEGRYGLVRDRLLCEPLSGHLFLFCNGQRNRLKVLVWAEADSGSVPRGWRKGVSLGRTRRC